MHLVELNNQFAHHCKCRPIYEMTEPLALLAVKAKAKSEKLW